MARRVAAACLGLVLGTFGVLTPESAQAHKKVLPSVTSVVVTRVTTTSVTVAVVGHAHHYQLFVATSPKRLASSALAHASHSVATFRSTVTARGLSFVAKPLYYRVAATTGSHAAYSAIGGPVRLIPATPTGVEVAPATAGALSLTWSRVAGTGYEVFVADDFSTTQNVQTYKLSGPGVQFTPPNLMPGSTYYLSVAAVNGTAISPASAPIGATAVAHAQSITTMTYNVREASLDQRPDGEYLGSPWGSRKLEIASVIEHAMPDVVAVQEAASFVNGSTTQRQIDDLADQFDGVYELASTEVPPTQIHYRRAADYILYNPQTVTADDPVDHLPSRDYWNLGEAAAGSDHWAAYQEFTDIASGAKFLFVSFHLQQPTKDDQIRQNQTETLLADASAKAKKLGGIPVVYAGDINSTDGPQHAFDGPRVAMRAQHVADADDVALTHVNAQYNSFNGYRPTPAANGRDIDAIFVSPGIAATSWNLLVNVADGQYVLPLPSDHNALMVGISIPY